MPPGKKSKQYSVADLGRNIDCLKTSVTKLHFDVDDILTARLNSPRKQKKQSKSAVSPRDKKSRLYLNLENIGQVLQKAEIAKLEAMEFTVSEAKNTSELIKENRRLFGLLALAAEDKRKMRKHIQLLEASVNDLLFENDLALDRLHLEKKAFQNELRKHHKHLHRRTTLDNE